MSATILIDRYNKTVGHYQLFTHESNDIKNALSDMIGQKTSYHRYLPESLTAEGRLIGLYVLESGYSLLPPGAPYPPSLHDKEHFDTTDRRILSEYQIVYITRGRGVFKSKTTGVIPIEAGTVFILSPGVWHRYAPDQETGWDEYWVGFNGEIARQLMLPPFLNLETPVIPIGQNEALLLLFIEIAEAVETGRSGSQLLISAWVLQIIARLREIQQSNERDSELEEKIHRAQCRLQEQINHSVCMPDLAKELNLGYSLFRKVFADYTGVAPAQYHLQLRIRKACELLSTTHWPINRIADELGFGSAYYFSRIFSTKTGQSPTAFRATCRSGGTKQDTEF